MGSSWGVNNGHKWESILCNIERYDWILELLGFKRLVVWSAFITIPYDSLKFGNGSPRLKSQTTAISNINRGQRGRAWTG